MEALGGLPDGILLTHAHIGHYLGLAQLGREVLGAKKVPVYCTPSMASFLRSNKPWSRLVALENIAIREIQPGVELPSRPTSTSPPTACRTATRIPTRSCSGFADRDRKLLWLPDIDELEKWDRKLADFLADRRSRRSSTAPSSPPTSCPAARSPRSRIPSFRRRWRSSRRARRRRAASCSSTSTTRTGSSGMQRPSTKSRERVLRRPRRTEGAALLGGE